MWMTQTLSYAARFFIGKYTVKIDETRRRRRGYAKMIRLGA
jgi:hypothetical protein